MDDWRSNDRRGPWLRDLWLPVLVAVVGVMLSVAVWGLLIEDHRDDLHAAAEETASETRTMIERSLRDQLETVSGLRDLWQTFGLSSRDEWMANVGQRVDHVTGLEALTWADLDGKYRRIATGSRPESREDRAVEMEEGRLTIRPEYADGPILEGPVPEESGDITYRIILPVQTPDARTGLLIARFDATDVLDGLLQARAPGYALTVRWDGVTVFSRDTPLEDEWQGPQRVERPIALPLGGQWQLIQQPTERLAIGQLNPAIHYLLGAGILLSLVLAVLVHQLRVIVRQSRFLKASNLSLEKRGAELESKVADRTEALQDAIDELEAFNYSVSHDLRSPLGAILNFTTILEEDHRDRPLDDAGVALLDRIRRSAHRALDLLEDLLKLSRAGRAALDFDTIDMESLARESFMQVRIATGDDEMEFIVDPLPDAVGDRTLLADVFANLFSNAIKYSRGCEKRCIRVSGHLASAPPSNDAGSETAGSCDVEAVYEVADNGHGFDMRFADKIFGLFERLHGGDDVEGTGVGLAMVARIVKRHGGRAWAEGKPGEGARISFSLPQREAP